MNIGSGTNAAASGAKLRLFCFPPAGGRVVSFNGWRRRLPPAIDLEPVQLPGRDPDAVERLHTRLDSLMPAMWPALAFRLDRPYALYGHGLGALVAFEFARYARTFGFASPLALFVSGHRAPQCALRVRGLHGLPDAALTARLAEMGGTPDMLIRHPQWRRHLVPALRADLQMSERYEYRAEKPLRCPLYAFRGYQDPMVTEAEMRAWAVQTHGRFALETLSGAHFFDNDGLERLTEVIVWQLLEQEPPQLSGWFGGALLT